jgi:hypothetical protein
MLYASHSSQAPRPQWTEGSPAFGVPPTWLPPPPVGFWLSLGPGFWRPPMQPYSGQPRGHPPPQMGQGYWSPPWGSPLGGHAPPPFGSPPSRSPLLRPTTSIPSTVRNYFVILTHPFRIPNMSIYMSFRAAQDHNKAVGRDMTSSTTSSTREDPTAMMRRHSSCFTCCELVLKLSYMLWCIYLFPIYSACYGGSLVREAAKTGVGKKIKNIIFGG